MVGIRSPDGLVVGSSTSHPGVLGSVPKREEPGKTGAQAQPGCAKVPGSSRVPLRPRLVVSRSTCPPLTIPPHTRKQLCNRYCSNKTHTHTFRFNVKRATFYQSLKSKVGLAATKAAELRINLNVEGCVIVAAPVNALSRAPSPPPFLSHNLPLPRVH